MNGDHTPQDWIGDYVPSPGSWKINDVSADDDMIMREIQAYRVLANPRRASKASIIRDGIRALHNKEVKGNE
jgi:hypothetical protein